MAGNGTRNSTLFPPSREVGTNLKAEAGTTEKEMEMEQEKEIYMRKEEKEKDRKEKERAKGPRTDDVYVAAATMHPIAPEASPKVRGNDARIWTKREILVVRVRMGDLEPRPRVRATPIISTSSRKKRAPVWPKSFLPKPKT